MSVASVALESLADKGVAKCSARWASSGRFDVVLTLICFAGVVCFFAVVDVVGDVDALSVGAVAIVFLWEWVAVRWDERRRCQMAGALVWAAMGEVGGGVPVVSWMVVVVWRQ